MSDTITTELPAFELSGHNDYERRSVERRWVLTDTRHRDRHGDLETAALQLRVSHYKERRCFLVSVDRVVVTRFGFRQTIDFRRSAPERIRALSQAVPAARYSRKALDELYVVSLALVEANLPEALAWAAGAVDEDA